MSPISPRIDVVFKKIFGVEENKDLLISLINSIVSQDDQVADVIVLNPYNPKNFRDDKLSILDIKAKGLDGKRFNIELQITDEADYDKRALYYWAKLYTEQLKTGDDYSKLSKAIGIHILNFTSIPEEERYHNIFHITEKQTGLVYFKDLELHTIELKKFTRDQGEELKDIADKIKSSLDMWAAFLTRHDLLKSTRLPPELDNAVIEKAINVIEVMSFNEEERNAYEDHLKWYMIELNTLKKAEDKGFTRGIEEGIEKGFSRGIEEGIEKGFSRGIEEGTRKGFTRGIEEGTEKGFTRGIEEGFTRGIEEGIEKGFSKGIEEGIEIMATKMLARGKSVEEVIDITGLTKEQVTKLNYNHLNKLS